MFVLTLIFLLITSKDHPQLRFYKFYIFQNSVKCIFFTRMFLNVISYLKKLYHRENSRLLEYSEVKSKTEKINRRKNRRKWTRKDITNIILTERCNILFIIKFSSCLHSRKISFFIFHSLTKNSV